jgi:hypothetical protein
MEQQHGTIANLLQGAEFFRRPFMEPEGSLPCSQAYVIGPYPEPDESTLQFLTLFT